MQKIFCMLFYTEIISIVLHFFEREALKISRSLIETMLQANLNITNTNKANLPLY